MKPAIVLLSCEHAVNHVPDAYEPLFQPYHDLLNSHRGLDIGASAIADYLSESLRCALVKAQATRLLIDCNRSLRHPHCFSEITRSLSLADKETIKQQFYLPFRQQVESHIHEYIKQGRQVWHLSIHSFTPILDGQCRNADIGLLYDPKRPSERTIAKRWQQEIRHTAPPLRVRLNYPYRGTSDGFTCALRKRYSSDDYAGIEVETNQALAGKPHALTAVASVLAVSLRSL
ncbi:N-formylglutamate amidohydrolase [Legionella spiritensis]|uniref:N-formylglutamate amidohydrolase n=1 Tax=Legionella spiritensis TaxID=452 RepID=A0A0W0Z1C5_LEGSP|nr:N-formylglutamate amidohydrolase [Legionella spiritensis]KTD62550.1 N-formylglutamate amidohydrolase [Legionella spiritensis]SNV30693.1 N-formylglutamate amidohydrolase [Legionella spiritensis]